MMWIFVRALSNASMKIVATFFMVLLLVMAGILYAPGAYNGVNDFANYVANLDMVRNPDFGEQGVAVTRVFINEATIFGVVCTLIARAVVEVLFFTLGMMWRLANGKPLDPVEAAVQDRLATEEKAS
ncbi:MAG: hypothetical protein AAGG45_09805 [Pseudomonadota bacterium]